MRRAFYKKLEAGKQNTIEYHSAELIEYQTPSLLSKNCTVSISKDQSLRVEGFPCFPIGYLFIDTQSFSSE